VKKVLLGIVMGVLLGSGIGWVVADNQITINPNTGYELNLESIETLDDVKLLLGKCELKVSDINGIENMIIVANTSVSTPEIIPTLSPTKTATCTQNDNFMYTPTNTLRPTDVIYTAIVTPSKSPTTAPTLCLRPTIDPIVYNYVDSLLVEQLNQWEYRISITHTENACVQEGVMINYTVFRLGVPVWSWDMECGYSTNGLAQFRFPISYDPWTGNLSDYWIEYGIQDNNNPDDFYLLTVPLDYVKQE
jgi:hypothetical protein